MTGATLIVSRVGPADGLRFVLQAGRTGAVMEARTPLTREQRLQIDRSLRDFADCAVSAAGNEADEHRIAALGQVLFQIVLPPPVRKVLRDLNGPLTLLTDDPTLPWEILHDGTDFIALRLPFARQLIAQEQINLLLRSRAAPEGKKRFSALVIADPTGDLPGALAEGRALHALFSGQGTCDFLSGGAATREAIQQHLIRTDYTVIHYCGHIDYDPATRSASMRLDGKGRLSADDVMPAFRGHPLVFLNACRSDRHSALPDTRPETFGRTESFAQAFMMGGELGAAEAVVGTMWRIPDDPADAGQVFAQHFYERLFAQDSLGDALRASRRLARENKWGPLVWGPYVLYGSPDSKPLHPAAPPAGATDPAPPALPRGAEFDADARRVIRVAVREMQQLGQRALGTMHLLVAHCATQSASLRQVAHTRGVDLDTVADKARALAHAVLPDVEDDALGISENVIATMGAAAQRARLLGEPAITADHLLTALLENDASTAVQLLAAQGIDRKAVLALLPALRVGPLAAGDCAGDAWRVLLRALREAEKKGQGVVGTPDLAAALLRSGHGPLARALRRVGIDVESVQRVLGEDRTAP